MVFWNRDKNTAALRVIKTARSKDEINEGARSGFRPLVKKLEPSDEISSKYAVAQNKKTGEIKVIGDYRASFDMEDNEEFEIVIDWTWYYPYQFQSPFAAYLIPPDIAIGERVYVEDLIEDFIGIRWNQGDTYRLEICEAIWNGKDLEIQYDPKIIRSDIVG
jgi:hypothetical protein